MRCFLLVCLTLLLSSCSDVHEIKVGNNTFHFPKENLSADYSHGDGELLEYGYDTANLEFALTWSADELERAIKGYVKSRGEHNFPNPINAGFYSITPDKRVNRENPERYKDAFLLEGKYEGARVEYDKQNSIFKVYDPARNNWAWEVLKQKPGHLSVLPKLNEDYWVGSCRDLPGIMGLTCRTDFTYRNYFLSVDIPGSNIRLRDQIKDFIISQVESWRVKN